MSTSEIDRLIAEVDQKIQEADNSLVSSLTVGVGRGKLILIIIIAIVLIVVILVFVVPFLKRRHESAAILEGKQNKSEKIATLSELNANQARWEYFYQGWCKTCKVLRPAIDEYMDYFSGDDFRLVLHNCGENTPENQECPNYPKVPVFLYRPYAGATAVIYRGPSKAQAIDEWVKSLA